MSLPYIKTGKTITVIIDGIPQQVDSTHVNYKRINKILTKDKPITEQAMLDLLKPMEAFKTIVRNNASFTFENNKLTCEVDAYEFTIPSKLHSYVVKLHNSKGNITPLLAFIEKLARNPRMEVIDELWGFIEACGLAITESGNFLAYKNVNSDFMDIYTGTMDNSPGQTLYMPRHSVEHNPDRTCAPGLHFAAWGYLSHYSNGGKTVILSISPEHVVSIPSDYNNMKGRACEYTVLREVAQPEELKGNPIYSDDGYEYDDEDDYDFYDDKGYGYQ